MYIHIEYVFDIYVYFFTYCTSNTCLDLDLLVDQGQLLVAADELLSQDVPLRRHRLTASYLQSLEPIRKTTNVSLLALLP